MARIVSSTNFLKAGSSRRNIRAFGSDRSVVEHPVGLRIGGISDHGGEQHVVEHEGVGPVDTMLSACLAGAGVAQVMAFGVEDLIASGELIEIFPDWPDETFPLFAAHPSRRHVPAKTRAFIEFCQQILSAKST